MIAFSALTLLRSEIAGIAVYHTSTYAVALVQI